MDGSSAPSGNRDKLALGVVVVVALGIAVLGARPYAGGWNDGSRLATVETLVDRHTWIIDDSIFVRVPSSDAPAVVTPYDPDEPGLRKQGTLDKLFIDGHFYSDKSPVPALLMAGCYQLWQFATGWSARQHPDHFCRAMTLISSGLAYVIAAMCIYLLGRTLRLPLSSRLLLTASFALATVAAPYVQHVNNHILLLAVTAALVLGLAQFVEATQHGRRSWRRPLILGSLAGLAYTIDLGVGPVVLLCTCAFVLSCCLRSQWKREQVGAWSPPLLFSLSPCLFFGLAALPWLLLHHALNFAIGGCFTPANANPAFFRWPGSPFHVHNLTGRWIHTGPFSFLLYAASLLAGKRGFLGHNLPLFLTLPALVMLLRSHRERWREVLWALGCCCGSWLLYAATSNNSSGQCCSIRWFVPLLAPAYFVLALFLKQHPRYRLDLLLISGWGMILVLFMNEGPWLRHMVPFFWPIQAAALGSWALLQYLRRQKLVEPSTGIGGVWNRVGMKGRGGPWWGRPLTPSPFDVSIDATSLASPTREHASPLSATAR